MSENQQPLDEEQAVSDVQEQETLPAAAEDTLPAAQDENAPAILDAEPEEEEEDIDPADVKIFGMKRHVFQLTCLGAAVGYILCGLVGILGEKMQGTGRCGRCRLLYRLASGEKARSCSCGRTGRTRAAQ